VRNHRSDSPFASLEDPVLLEASCSVEWQNSSPPSTLKSRPMAAHSSEVTVSYSLDPFVAKPPWEGNAKIVPPHKHIPQVAADLGLGVLVLGVFG
jgi:hypothetical protein